VVFNERGYDGNRHGGAGQAPGPEQVEHLPPCLRQGGTPRTRGGPRLDALFAVLDEEQDPDNRAADTTATARMKRIVHRSVEVLAAELPTHPAAAPHGNSEVEQRALARRREFDHRVAELMTRAAAEGGIREDIDPTSPADCCSAPSTPRGVVPPDRDLSVGSLADALTAILFDASTGNRELSRPGLNITREAAHETLRVTALNRSN